MNWKIPFGSCLQPEIIAKASPPWRTKRTCWRARRRQTMWGWHKGVPKSSMLVTRISPYKLISHPFWVPHLWKAPYCGNLCKFVIVMVLSWTFTPTHEPWSHSWQLWCKSLFIPFLHGGVTSSHDLNMLSVSYLSAQHRTRRRNVPRKVRRWPNWKENSCWDDKTQTHETMPGGSLKGESVGLCWKLLVFPGFQLHHLIRGRYQCFGRYDMISLGAKI